MQSAGVTSVSHRNQTGFLATLSSNRLLYKSSKQIKKISHIATRFITAQGQTNVNLTDCLVVLASAASCIIPYQISNYICHPINDRMSGRTLLSGVIVASTTGLLQLVSELILLKIEKEKFLTAPLNIKAIRQLRRWRLEKMMILGVFAGIFGIRLIYGNCNFPGNDQFRFCSNITKFATIIAQLSRVYTVGKKMAQYQIDMGRVEAFRLVIDNAMMGGLLSRNDVTTFSSSANQSKKIQNLIVFRELIELSAKEFVKIYHRLFANDNQNDSLKYIQQIKDSLNNLSDIDKTNLEQKFAGKNIVMNKKIKFIFNKIDEISFRLQNEYQNEFIITMQEYNSQSNKNITEISLIKSESPNKFTIGKLRYNSQRTKTIFEVFGQ